MKFLGLYSLQAINLFIGYLFSIYADHIKENDYTEHHKYLMDIDSKLHEVISDFWRKWETFDVEKIDPIYNSDLILTDSLIDGLTTWANYKTVIAFKI